MLGLAHGLQQSAVAIEPVSIPSLALAWLEQRLKVVEHQQARPVAQELEQRAELVRVAGRWQLLAISQIRRCHPCHARATQNTLAGSAPV
jgi:hypothetical protein